jgi:flavin-dependent dehydrogenase
LFHALISNSELYDVAIVGGGLAGLALSIQSSKKGYKTILVEKERYPFHRVCGEYISMESWNFLESLGLNLIELNVPIIRKVRVSAPNGKFIQQALPLGGFGISRFKIDNLLANIARQNGVHISENTKVNEINYDGSVFSVNAGESVIHSKVCCGAFGKRSNLDLKWERSFATKKKNKLNNYIGIKYHVNYDSPDELISLHNFEDGYCGISKIEDDKYCLCYLTTAHNLQKNGNSISEMEKNVLMKNPYLNEIFSKAEFLWKQPEVISQISFERKTLIEDHVLMIGDSAGMITPLCGNGMSMALHSSQLAFNQIDLFLTGKIDRNSMENSYSVQWKKYFAGRLRMGRLIQRFFGSPLLSQLLITSLKPFPKVSGWLIRKTHGKPF